MDQQAKALANGAFHMVEGKSRFLKVALGPAYTNK